MKMKLPTGAGSAISISGVSIKADERGFVDVPDTHVEAMKSHGLTVPGEGDDGAQKTLGLKK